MSPSFENPVVTSSTRSPLAPRQFLDPLYLEYLDGRRWRVTATFQYRLGTPGGDEYIHVPAGFVTDFASIPRPLWPLYPPTGRYGKAAVVHDYLYHHRIIHSTYYCRLTDRGEADQIFREAMIVLEVGLVTRSILYSGVWSGGWVSWNKYRRREFWQ